jgi:hypothetical protein
MDILPLPTRPQFIAMDGSDVRGKDAAAVAVECLRSSRTPDLVLTPISNLAGLMTVCRRATT